MTKGGFEKLDEKNINNSRSSMQHEKAHTTETKETLLSEDGVTKAKVELRAIKKQKKHKTWEKTTPSYRIKVNDYEKLQQKMLEAGLRIYKYKKSERKMIHNKILILIIMAFLILTGCNNKEKLYKTDSNSFTDLIVKIVDDRYYISVLFKNTTSDTLGIYCIGDVWHKGIKNTILEKMLYDTYIEIKQNNKTIRSNEVEFNYVAISERMYQLILLEPGSEYSFPIFYIGNLREDFNLDNTEYCIRLIIVPPCSYIKDIVNEIYGKKIKKMHDIKIVQDTIFTPYLNIK